MRPTERRSFVFEPSSFLKGIALLQEPQEACIRNKLNGGESGIRTRGPVARSPVFKTGAFNRSAISPQMKTTTIPYG
jgi:hypothetical protein